MTYGLCTLSIVALRSAPKHSSEMVSQLLWGECYEVLEEQEEWLKIRCAFDKYEAWLDRKQHKTISLEQWQVYTACKHFASSAISYIATVQQYQLLGSPILTSPSQAPTLSISSQQKQLYNNALLLLNTPYLWGGRSVFGIDCSGYMQLIYRLVGVFLPRDAYQQADCGELISFEEQQLGDLAFFANTQGRITHVGMVWTGEKIIHASGKVRIDTLDRTGILVVDNYSHQLAYIKRVLNQLV